MPGGGKHILCTGGAGYIGSHTVIRLLEHGYEVSIMDDLSNTSDKVIGRLKEITGKDVPLHVINLLDFDKVKDYFKSNKVDGVIHFAAKKAVGESVAKPLMYYENNVAGTVNLLKAMVENNCKCIVFSSSATVYKPSETPLTETAELGASNPYGQTKLMMEQVLTDLHTSDKNWKVSILRYFNPVGAHPSGRIGESPEVPANLLPFIQQVAVGRKKELSVFGNDWPTVDGTGVRDYLHVEDLAEGHVKALDKLFAEPEGCCLVHNLGTGRGYSVLELVTAFEKASGKKIPYTIVGRRPGDLASVIADPKKANEELKWKAVKTIE
uniref:UDP-glucose 4-epimerase n=1 Tax=Chromera velia CCMP2878 TaxID=1169474 RepID=A0A0G4HYL5_9ALVE|eukprot:Cvel_33611.t1-p1 / transcript=Cvel_33611.t1 / gene=Cvel_33611 / organism=Chromera_velia_CCMP2878 / gene_product=UDP-glucose 4-epimerase, putative / transcript_product=UDP-glucose 4-epimerase, putative / location=Cvel_scaffold5501:883-4855(+) / protein_length=323 / sequence_SO=supercontig / SO=protein_coding / is_pseudo=false